MALDGGDLGPERLRWRPPFPVGRIVLSASGRFIVAQSLDGQAAELRETGGPTSSSIFRTTKAEAPMAAVDFAEARGAEVVLASSEPMRLQVLNPATAETLIDQVVARPRGFCYRFFSSVTDGDSIMAVGYFMHEEKDSVVMLSTSAISSSTDYLGHALHRPVVHDYARRLSAGPAGAFEAVFYRDAEGEDDEDFDDDPHPLDVYGFGGVYIRQLSDATILQRIPYDSDIRRTGDPIFATADYVVLGDRREITLIARDGGGIEHTVPATCHAFHPPTKRIVSYHGTTGLQLINLPGDPTA